MTDLSLGLDSLISAIPDYVTAAQMYSGSVDELFFSPAMKRQLARSGNADLRINLAKIAVDVVGDRLEVAALSASDDKAADTLIAVTVANELDLVLPSLFKTALTYGDAYLILDGDSETGVNLFDNSPLTTRIVYSAENPRVKAFAIKRFTWDQDSDFIRVNLYYADRTERYITAKRDDKGVSAAEFVPYTNGTEDDTDHVVANAYGFIPVYHFRAGGRPYGVPEHKEAYGPQHAVNKLAITHLSTIDYLGFPQRYIMAAQGSDGSEIDDFDADIFHDAVNPGATEIGPGEDANLTVGPYGRDVPDSSGLKANPGGVWTLPNGTQAGQFDAADSENFINSVSMYVRLMAQTTNTPLHYFDPSGDTPSGESLRVADAPLVKKVRNRSLSFGSALQDALSDALTLYGFDDASVMVHWASPESTDSLSNFQVAQAKIDAGVPVYNALQEAGYLDEQLEAMGITPDDSGFGETVTKLGDLGKALQYLGSAVTAGIVSADAINGLLAGLIPDAEAA